MACGPEVQGVAVAAALEAVEGVVVEVGGEAAARARGRAVQGAWASLLAACGWWAGSQAVAGRRPW